MLNQRGSSDDMSELVGFEEFVLGTPCKIVQLYGKRVCHKGRKMGHKTITANTDAQARARLRVLLQRLPGGDVADSGASDIDLYAPEASRPGFGLSHKQPLAELSPLHNVCL